MLRTTAVLTLNALAIASAIPCQTPDRQAQAKSLISENRFDEAATELKSILAKQPDSADAHYLLGYVLFRKVAARESLAEYTRAAELRRPTAFDLKIVGCDYVLIADYMDADKWFSKVVEWTPQDVEAWYFLGRAKYNENRFEEAVQTFQHTLALDPKHLKAEDNLGLCFEGLGRLEDAERAYRQAIAWQPSGAAPLADPYINLGALLVSQNKAAEAVPLLTRALAIAPGDYRPHLQIGKAYLAENQVGKAREELIQAIRIAPKNASLHYVLGQVYRKDGMTEQAKAEFARYTELNNPAH